MTDELWNELLMDALASDGRISDADVKNAVKRWRPRLEAVIRAGAVTGTLSAVQEHLGCACGGIEGHLAERGLLFRAKDVR